MATSSNPSGVYTVYETGTKLVAAQGQYHCPRDAWKGPNATAWIDIPDDEFNPGLGFAAGTWDWFSSTELPESIVKACDAAYVRLLKERIRG
jgi:hypothetical protein